MKTTLLRGALCALFCLTQATLQAATSVNSGSISQITGPSDANLDLKGEMTYAINFSPNDPPMFVNGVKFQPDTSFPGLTVGPNNVAPWQTKPNFGSGIDQDNLEEIYQDIRWANAGAGQTVEAHLPVTVGETYKVQLLVYGNHPGDNRRWDIEIEGAIAVDEFTSLGASTGGSPGTLPAYSSTAGVIYSRTITVADGTLDVRMGNLGGVNDGGDRNPIWQGLTLEHVVPDTDGDGLPDAYETTTFGGIGAQTGAGDADSDGLSNQYEYQLGSNPNVADTDGDTLTDGAEYFTHRTNILAADTDGDGLDDAAEIAAGSNPFVADTDGDGLLDGPEVLIYGTSPIDVDTDNDSYFDKEEVTYGTNPLQASSFPLYTSRSIRFSGGDNDEGLDFDGTFLAAARFGVSTLTGSWPVRSATFIPYTQVPGLTQNFPNEIGGWVAPAFPAATANDNNLATVISSIRYGGPVMNVTIPGLTSGQSYKVQMLFAEACCGNRGFDIYVEGNLVADEFAVATVQGGVSGAPTRGAAFVYGFVATDNTLNITFNKLTTTNPALNDPNVILNALTVEAIPPGADSDGDTLPDAWELQYFPNLLQGPGDDPDNDGLTNYQELLANTIPNDPDSDDDGLNDGQEVNTVHSNPRIADTDGDGLSDGAEVNTHFTDPNDFDSDNDVISDGAEVISGTNPNSIDTDNDGYNDPTELLNGSNPLLGSSVPGTTHIARVLGADAAEGLDLTGNFLYAFNVGTPGAAGLIHDANFTADTAPGITVDAPNEIGFWNNPDFGSGAADNALEFVFQSIRWADLGNGDPAKRSVKVNLANLVPGRQYKLQLLFGEACCPNRTFDLHVEGTEVISDFVTRVAQGGFPMPGAGSAMVHTFTATDSTLNIVLDGGTTSTVSNPGNDPNAILSGVTLEELTIPVPLEIAGITTVPGGIKLDFRGTPGHTYSVDWAPDLATWEEVNDTLVPNANGDATWTDTDINRVGPAARRGFYKLRDPTP